MRSGTLCPVLLREHFSWICKCSACTRVRKREYTIYGHFHNFEQHRCRWHAGVVKQFFCFAASYPLAFQTLSFRSLGKKKDYRDSKWCGHSCLRLSQSAADLRGNPHQSAIQPPEARHAVGLYQQCWCPNSVRKACQLRKTFLRILAQTIA